MAVLELVIYAVKTEALETFPSGRNRMHRALSEWEGFKSGVTLQSIDNAHVFADYILWNNLDQARKAAERVKSAPEMRDFLDCIGETIAFHHFEVGSDQSSFKKAAESDVFEVALGIVDPAKREIYRSIKPELMELVGRERGFLEVASAETETSDGWLTLDVLRWQSAEAAKGAMDNIHQTEQCGTFMQTFKKDVHFDHMRLFPRNEGK